MIKSVEEDRSWADAGGPPSEVYLYIVTDDNGDKND
jgi:hypothetical protein